MKTNISEKSQVSPVMTLFLIHAMQVGVGILGFERYISAIAGHDAWMAVITTGISTHIVLWIMYRLLEKSSGGDLIALQQELFGKYIGWGLNFLVLIYFLSFVLTILRTYIEVIQVWIFPEFSVWALGFIILLLAHSFVIGGFRTVTGICFLSFIYGAPLFIVKYFPLQYANFSNLMPIMEQSPLAILKATKVMTLSFLGFGLFMLYYPFIKRPKQSKKWAHFGLLTTTYTYLVTALVSYVYFSQGQLKHTIWSTLSLWKIVSFPVFERFEYVGITIWLFVVLPNICLGIWAVTRGAKLLFSVRQKIIIPTVLIILFISNGLFQNRIQVDTLNSLISTVGFYFLYVYIPFIFIYQCVLLKVRKPS
ncbi:spore germination protein (amino acid permease) [Scopulibacillus darangshiensis]|uniref:Spore germination protein (Amino acid permease) n=1 Tax=Scopulibacillus darangshiensis TaxID=442528 RepID=A0A4R2NYY2_9BACL|nr:GerAB/ArcD/ProY family transporter [Scopulibacillus darangshiensis]TCP26625.1 spore germination protein (amino acid permease) [Scopulibacillus darangshiensis]